MNQTDEDSRTDLAILVSFSGAGGVERMVLNMVNAMADMGVAIDLLLIKTDSNHLKNIHPMVNRIDLGTGHTLTSLFPLTRYLKRVRPPRLLAAKDRAGRIAVIARALSGSTDTQLGLRLGTNLTASFAHKPAWKMWLRRFPIRLLYPQIEAIIAISKGVRQDTIEVSGVASNRVHVVPNPVITPALFEDASAPPPHPWLAQDDPPLILGVGRLTLQKDFPTLIRAFAHLRQNRTCRLIILGEGSQRKALENLAKELDIEQDLILPGFTSNPFVYMKHASLLVLSSRWEGSGNVLTEAMALGTPVVATDCPSGPSETLDQGRIAPLVPMGDWRHLADAMAEVLDQPMPPEVLQHAVREYTATTSAKRYLEILGVTPNNNNVTLD